MADKRRLNAEIDRTLKKVAEGMEAFDDIWKKLHQSNNANQKDKLEADLKKEIKKLQRLRDQLKLWLVSPDIKDKQLLMENRKNIEAQMEKFKVIERETKTKAYSKEGLVASGKVDPKEKEKEDILNWISNAISNLNQQYEKLESEAEALSSRKKKLDKEDSSRLESCQSTLEQHRFHINKLEAILRLVDNSAVQFKQIQSIRENVEYYVESNNDVDFESNELIYDELDLDAANAALKSEVNTATSSASEGDGDALSINIIVPNSPQTTSSSHPALHHHKAKDDDGKKKPKPNDDFVCAHSLTIGQNKGANKVTQSSNLNYPNTSRPVQTPTKLNLVSASSTHPQPLRSITVSTSGLGYAQVASCKLMINSPSKLSTNAPNGLVVPSANHQSFPNVSSSSASQHTDAMLIETISNIQSSDLPTPTSSVITNAGTDQSHVSPLTNGALLSFCASQHDNINISQTKWPSVGEDKRHEKNITNGNLMSNGCIMQSDIKEGQNPFLKALNADSSMTSSPTNLESQQVNGNPHEMITGANQLDGKSLSPHLFKKQHIVTNSSTRSVCLNPIYSVAPLGCVSLNKDQIMSKLLLESAVSRMPLPCDSEKVRIYLPNNPCAVPAYYPVALPPIMQYPDYFSKLEPDTLFFVFYYMEGTKAQYQAAKALKQKSWRFHTKYMTWFQRHEEPKTITEEFEQGTYIFFDFEKWIQRKKESFKFEYRYLEDHELV